MPMQVLIPKKSDVFASNMGSFLILISTLETVQNGTEKSILIPSFTKEEQS